MKLVLKKPLSLASIIISLLGIFLSLFQPFIVPKLPVFLDGPAFLKLIQSINIFTLSILVVISCGYIAKHFSKEKFYSFLPFLINAISISIIVFFPLSSIWPENLIPPDKSEDQLFITLGIFKWKDLFYADYDQHRDEYNEVIHLIENGELKVPSENYSLIDLPKNFEYLSRGGGQIMIEKKDDRFQVFFYTFRGVLDNFSGYMYKPDGKKPTTDDFLGDWKQILKIDENWYYCASY